MNLIKKIIEATLQRLHTNPLNGTATIDYDQDKAGMNGGEGFFVKLIANPWNPNKIICIHTV